MSLTVSSMNENKAWKCCGLGGRGVGAAAALMLISQVSNRRVRVYCRGMRFLRSRYTKAIWGRLEKKNHN